MKKQPMFNGFSAYTVDAKGNVYAADAKKVTVKGGQVQLTCSEDTEASGTEGADDYVPPFVKGTVYPFEVSGLKGYAAGLSFEDTPATDNKEGGEGDKKEDEAPKETSERTEKLKELKKAEADALTALSTVQDPTQLPTLVKAWQDAKAAHEAYKATPKKVTFTAEEQAIIDAYEADIKSYTEQANDLASFRAHIEATTGLPEKYSKHKFKGGNAVSTGDGSAPQRAPHMEYETIQQLRKDYSVGRYGNVITPEIQAEMKERYPDAELPLSISAVAEKAGCSPSTAKMKIDYTQSKLRRMPADTDMTQPENVLLYTAFTPLVNEHYPALGAEFNETGTDGAPYFEDGIKENANRYVKAALRTEPSVTNKPAETVTA